LGFGEEDDGEAALANKRRISEEFIGFDLSERDCFGEGLSGFELNGGILGVRDVDRKNGGGADGGFVVAGFVDDEACSGGHLGEVTQGNGIVDAVPGSFLVALKIGEGILRRLGFEEIVGWHIDPAIRCRRFDILHR